MTAGFQIPAVSEIEASDDRYWFAEHPSRRYRSRPGPDGTLWVIRRRGRDVCLRTLFTPAFPYPDTDEALRQAWFLAAYPSLSEGDRDALIEAARKSERPANNAHQRRAKPRRRTKARRGPASASGSAAPDAEPEIHIPNVTTRPGAPSACPGAQPPGENHER